MQINTKLLIALMLISSVCMGIIVYFGIMCLFYSCYDTNLYKLPLDGFKAPFVNGFYKSIPLFFFWKNPYLYILISLLIVVLYIITNFKQNKKVIKSKQVKSSQL